MTPVRVPTRRSAVKIAGGYAVAAVAWIACSGWLLHNPVPGPSRDAILQIVEEGFFVAITSVLLGWALDRYFGMIGRAVRLLRESEERWQFAIEGAGQAIWDWNPQTDEVFFSPQWRAMLGLGADEMGSVLAEWRQRIHPDDLVKVRMEVERHLAGETPQYVSEHRVGCKDGSWKWILDRGKVLSRDRDGKPLRVLGTYSDITERKKAQMALQESEARFREVEFTLRKWADAFENCAHGIALGDPKTNTVLACNPTLARMLGRQPDEVTGSRILSLYDAEDHERLKSWIAEADRTGEVRYESRMVRADGSSFPVQMDVVSVRDVAGKVLYRVATVQDITERKQAEHERQEALIKYRTLFDSFPLGITVSDRQGGIVETNPMAEGILGISIQEQRTRTIGGAEWRVVRPDGTPMPPEEYASVRALREERLVQNVEMGIVKSPTETTWINVTAAPLPLSSYGVVVTYGDITARKQAEAEIRHQAAMIKSLLDCIPDIIFFKDLDGIYLGCNPAFASYVGRSREQITGKGDHDLFPKEVADSFREYDCQMLESLRPRHNEEWINYPDGQRRLVDTLKTPFFGPGGQLQGVLGICRDITDRYEAQVALARLNKQNELILNSAAEGILGLDLQDRHVFVNAAAARMLGYTAEELLALPAHATWHHSHPDGSPYLPEACSIRSAFKGKATERISMEVFWRKDGTSFPVEYASTPIFEEGRVVGAVVSFDDITERQQTEAALRESEEQLRAMFEFASIGIAQADPQSGRWLQVNQKMSTITGYSVEELMQLRIAELTHPDDRQHDWDLFQRVLRGEASDYRVEKRYVRKDGRIVWVNVNVTVIHDAAGRPWRAMAAIEDISDRKQAEAKLADSQALMEYIIEHDRSCIAVHDRELRYVYVSQHYLDEYKVKDRDVIGKGHYEVFPDLPQKWRDVHQRALAGEVLNAEDDPYVRDDGTVEWTRWECRPWFESDGSIGGIIVYTEVITPRKRAEAALQESEARLRLALDAARMGTFDWDMPHNHLAWNRWHEVLWGYQPGEFDGTLESFTRRLHPDDAAGVSAEMSRCLAAREPYSLEFRVVWPNGSIHWIAGTGRYEFAPAGHPLRMRGTAVEVTKRRQAEESLEANRAMLDAALASMSDAVFISDVEGRFIQFNEAFATFHKFKDKVQCAKTLAEYPVFLDVFLPDGSLVPLEQWAVARALRGEIVTNAEYTLRRKDTGEAWVGSYSFAPIRDKTGAVVGSVVVGRDISERKNSEEALRQRNEELVRFTYTVSHDLKSPLVTIKTFLGYLEKDLVSRDASRIEMDMNYIRKAAEKMLRMLEELLELSRVGRKMNPSEEVSLQALAQEAQELVAGSIAERNVRVRVADVPILLQGDRQRLLEVFQNLLDNAVKFMGDQPSPQVDIGVEESEREIILFVRDNGMGVDPRHQDKLFGLFEKLHPGTPGTGVGLALVKRIVEVHGGRIWAESAGSGQGATFRFTLAGTRRS